MKNKIILYVVNSPSYFLAHHLPVALAIFERGANIHVASRMEPSYKEIEKLGFHFHSIQFSGRGTNPFVEIKTILSLRKLYKKLKPYICHHITIKPMIYGSIAARFSQPLHVVNSVTGLGYVFVDEGGWKKRFLRSIVINLFRFAFKLPSMVVRFENPDDKTEFVSLGIISEKKGVVIKGVGINLTQFFPQPEPESEEPPIIMFASRLLWYKGVKEFVEAAIILKKRKVRSRFVLVGTNDPDNPSSVPLTQIKEWVDSGNIEWWGFQKNMPEILSKASVVCLPTYYREGVPRILIEAAALAKPIVTTDEPGCRLIVSNQNGLLVPPKDSNALAKSLEKLIENKPLRHQMGKRGRELVEKDFGQETVINQTLAIYKEFLNHYSQQLSKVA